jgi:hypothetical protein
MKKISGINLKKKTNTLVNYGHSRGIAARSSDTTAGTGTDTTNTTFTILTTASTLRYFRRQN